MKKKVLFLALVMALAGYSCGNNNKKDVNAVKRAAHGYLYAMANYKVEDAIPYCTTETQEGVIARSIELVKQMNTADPTYIEKDTPAKIEILSVEMINDTTAIAHFHKTTPYPKDQNGQVDLVKRDGKWLVHIPILSKEEEMAKKGQPTMVTKEVNGQTIIGFKKPTDTPSQK